MRGGRAACCPRCCWSCSRRSLRDHSFRCHRKLTSQAEPPAPRRSTSATYFSTTTQRTISRRTWSRIPFCTPGRWGSRSSSTARQRAEAQAVRQSLAVSKGNLSRAAELLGVTRPTLYDLLGKHSIDAAQFGRHGPQAVETPAPELPAKDTGSVD